MRRHLTYANVMSTLGVFLALAGGFAIGQIGGDGSVRSGQVVGLEAGFKTVLSVPKLGKVVAKCNGGTTTRVAWSHTAPRNQQVAVEFEDATTEFKSNPGSVHEYTMSATEPTLGFHVSRSGGGDEPQTVIDVSMGGPSGACADQVAAEAVSTK